MKQWSYFTLLATVALVCIAGCAQQNAQSSRADGRRTDRDLANLLGAGTRRSLSSSAPRIRHLDVFQLTVPVGAISRSREFWKRVDEQSVDVATYDLLLKNGFRVGVAPASEWNYFRGIIEQHPAGKRQMTVTAGDAGSLELLMKKVPDGQDLWYFTDDGRLIGRTYDRSENILQVSFQAAPRKPGQVRMTLCPVVRSLRRKFQVTVLNEETEYEFVKPERMYDLNLCCDIPTDGFLVLAPSTLASWSNNLGSAFLSEGGDAERFEHVLLMVPRNAATEHVLEGLD